VVHGESSPAAGDVPAEAFAPRHVEAEGFPLPPFSSAPLAEKSSEAVDESEPHAVPRLASVGTPGEASAPRHDDARVGSSVDPPAADPPNAPVKLMTTIALMCPSDAETVVRLVSASAVGPEVAGSGVEPSGGDVLGSDVAPRVGTLADVPGPAAVVDPVELPEVPVV
jgi:hypothetical protein